MERRIHGDGRSVSGSPGRGGAGEVEWGEGWGGGARQRTLGPFPVSPHQVQLFGAMGWPRSIQRVGT